MLKIYYVLLSVYIFAVNFYGILMLKLQKNAKLNGEKNNKPISDAKLIFASFMGSALGVYVFMFILKYRIKSILFMTLIPVLIALNVFLFVFLYRNGLNFFV